MKPKTEQTLATLEVILDKGLWFMPPYHEDGGYFKPYIWDGEKQGVFSPLSLIKLEGWIQKADLEEAIKSWQWSEQTGLAAKGILKDGEPSCIEDNQDEAEILIDEDTKLARAKIYQNLFELLSNKVDNLQAFVLSCDFYYSLSVLVGQISDKKWIAICPTVPLETPFYFDDEIVCEAYLTNNISPSIDSSDLEIEIQEYINKLSSIKIYGWYDGGYNNIHEYRIVSATGESKEIALENLLLQSKLLETYRFNSFEISELLECCHDDEAQEIEIKSNQLNKFFKQAFHKTLLYRFCFWDYEHLYILGETGDRDRVGVSLHSQFTYNP